MAKPARSGRKKVKKNIPVGVAYITSTFNNTIVTITDPAGNAVSWSSAGKRGRMRARQPEGSPVGSMLSRRALFSCITAINTRSYIRAGGHV